MSIKGVDGIGTTDFVFEMGEYKVGYDIKASRTLYTKNFKKQNQVVDIMQSILEDSSNFKVFNDVSDKDSQFFKTLLYGIVNIAALEYSEKSGNMPDTSEKASKETYTSFLQALQRVVVVGTLVLFLDEYMASYTNEVRSQIIILLGDNVLFLSEFLQHLKNQALKVAGGGKTGELGFLTITSNNLAKKVPEEIVKNL